MIIEAADTRRCIVKACERKKSIHSHASIYFLYLTVLEERKQSTMNYRFVIFSLLPSVDIFQSYIALPEPELIHIHVYVHKG